MTLLLFSRQYFLQTASYLFEYLFWIREWPLVAFKVIWENKIVLFQNKALDVSFSEMEVLRSFELTKGAKPLKIPVCQSFAQKGQIRDFF